jgi:hypothetical protein
MRVTVQYVQDIKPHIEKFFGLERLSTFFDALFGFPIIIRHLLGLLWTSDQLVAKAFTDTEQHNI